MQKCKVMVNRIIEAAKFGVVLSPWVETTGWREVTNEGTRFFVEVPGNPIIRLVVDGKDVEVVDYHG